MPAVPLIEALSPRGLRVSIQDEAGVSAVRLHLSFNKPLVGAQRMGAINVEVGHREAGRWIYEDRTTPLLAGDVVHYWLQVDNAGRQLERAGKHVVQEFVETYDGGSAAAESTMGSSSSTGLQAETLSNQEERCAEGRSVSSVNGRLVCKGELLFLENFDGLEPSVWRHDVRIAGQPDYEFTTFLGSPTNTYVVNGQLVIRPTLLKDVFGEHFLKNGLYDLENCTAVTHDQCHRQAKFSYIQPPTISGRISTQKSFSFRYGRIEIRAKLPSGDWIYPELWLLPREEAYGAGLVSGRVQIAMARGNAALRLGATELGQRRLEAAVVAASSTRPDMDANPPPPRPTPVPLGPPATTAAISVETVTKAYTKSSSSPSGSKTNSTATRNPTMVKVTVSNKKGASSTFKRGEDGSSAAAAGNKQSPPARVTVTASSKPSGSQSAAPSVVVVVKQPSAGGVRVTETGSARSSSGSPSSPSWRDGDAADAWPRRVRAATSTSTSQYTELVRKEVSRTELPGRPWGGGFHNYTLQWTPDAMVFSVDGVELGSILPEKRGGLLPQHTSDPWRDGGRMAPFDREFYVSLGLAVGGVHNFPDGVEGPNGSQKPWKNTAAKAMLNFWTSKDEWYPSWSTDSALLVDFVRVTAL